MFGRKQKRGCWRRWFRNRGCVFIIYRLYALVKTSFVTERRKQSKKENVCPSIHYSLFRVFFTKPGHFSYASLSRQIISFLLAAKLWVKCVCVCVRECAHVRVCIRVLYFLSFSRSFFDLSSRGIATFRQNKGDHNWFHGSETLQIVPHHYDSPVLYVHLSVA